MGARQRPACWPPRRAALRPAAALRLALPFCLVLCQVEHLVHQGLREVEDQRATPKCVAGGDDALGAGQRATAQRTQHAKRRPHALRKQEGTRAGVQTARRSQAGRALNAEGQRLAQAVAECMGR